jgi:hypothetical protein
VKGALAILVVCGLVLGCTTPASVPTPSSPPPSPTPTVRPIATSSAVPVSATPAVHAVWTPVHLPATRGPVFVGGLGGGLDALPGGGFIDFVPVSYDRSEVLTSPDGLHWTVTGAVIGPYASGIGAAIAWDGHVYVALGSEQGGGYYGAQLNGAAWTSTDLRTWTKAPDQQGLAGIEDWSGLAPGPDGFVAIGYAQGGGTVWTSPDGLHWSGLVDVAVFPPESATPFDIAATSSGFLVVGRIDQQAAAWSSADGHHWTAYGPFPGGTGVVLDGLAKRDDGWLSLGIGGPATLVPPSLRRTGRVVDLQRWQTLAGRSPQRPIVRALRRGRGGARRLRRGGHGGHGRRGVRLG